MPLDRNAIGDRGEALFTNEITRRHGQALSMFRPQFLGGKYPAIDFVVEVTEAGGLIVPYFFVQIKATTLEYTKTNRLKAKISKQDMRRLTSFPAPTYVVGVDEIGERCFILAALNGLEKSYSSIPTGYQLSDVAVLQALRSEVIDYWSRHAATFVASQFS